MGRRDYPNAERIAKRARKLRDAAGAQRDLDTQSINQWAQHHTIEAHNRDAKAVGFAMVGNMVATRINILGARPFGRVLALGGHPAEEHVSGKLEPWVNTAVWLGQGDFEVWDTGLQDHQIIGEFWSVVLPAPRFHSGSEYQALIDEWKRRIEANENTEEIRESIRVYRRDHFPIVWRYVDPTSVFADLDDEGMAEVYYFRELTRRWLEKRFPNIKLDDKKEKFTVIDYANDVYVATVFPEGGGIAGTGIAREPGKFLGEPWAHEMGCNPYVRIRRGPVRANSQGYTRTGCAFNARQMSDTLDELLTDWRDGMHREVKSPLVYTLMPEVRQQYGVEDKKIAPDAEGNITLYGHKDYGVEQVARGPTPTINEQMPALIGLLGNQADRTGAWLPQLIGYGSSGESAVHQSTARQSAITGELEVPHRNLEEGFAAVCERFFRCVVALDKKLPEEADGDMRKIVVRAEDSKHKSKEIAVTASDVRNYELMVRGKIQKNLPVNMGANVVNLRELTDPDRPLIDDATGLGMFLNVDNPQEIEDKLFQQRVRRAGEEAYVESYAQRVKLIVDEFSDEELAKIAEKMPMAPEAAQAAVLGALGGEQGNRLMEQMARTQANVGRTGRGQRMSRLGDIEQEMPEEARIG